MASLTPKAVIQDFLSQKRLALVGVSHDGKGFGNVALGELSKKGYELFVVHPTAESIGGVPCVHALADVADRVDGVVIVTPPAETEKLVEQAAALGVKRVWMQQGAESDRAIRFCEEHGVAAVHHECVLMFAEPARWFHKAHRWARGVSGHLPT